MCSLFCFASVVRRFACEIIENRRRRHNSSKLHFSSIWNFQAGRNTFDQPRISKTMFLLTIRKILIFVTLIVFSAFRKTSWTYYFLSFLRHLLQ